MRTGTKRFVIAGCAVMLAAGAGVAISAITAPDPEKSVAHTDSRLATASGEVKARASWNFRAKSLEELAARAPYIVVAEVAGVSPGPSISDDSEADPTSALATQRIAFRTKDVVYGTLPDQFQLFKTGSAKVSLDGDPPYKVGESYLLFVERRVNGSTEVVPGVYVPISPDGRLKVKNSRLFPVIDGALADRIRGREVTAVKPEVQQAAQAAAPRRK